MEPTAIPRKAPVPVAIAAPLASDGAGSALRRAYGVPGALPDDMLKLLKLLDGCVSRPGG